MDTAGIVITTLISLEEGINTKTALMTDPYFKGNQHLRSTTKKMGYYIKVGDG